MSQIQNNSIFWVEIEKIKPNPYQPRREFDEQKLQGLAESIRQYGILQPLVVTRREIEAENGIRVEYELIAGERRFRASKIAGLFQVPVIIKEDEGGKLKLEIAIIENLQREDLNPVEKARAFKRLIEEFNLKHHEVASKVGKSREFVSNSVRVLSLPDEILKGLEAGKITEGHARPILMLSDQPEEQMRVYKEVVLKQMTVKETELISRRIAAHRMRKRDNLPDPATRAIEEKLSDNLGTRVEIERNGEKGRIVINFFSEEELQAFLSRVTNDFFEGNRDSSNGNSYNTYDEEDSQVGGEDDYLSRFTI
jgi:ParB family chromosome partitioning protein